MKPLVSILIPAFNARQWIADAIDSAPSATRNRTFSLCQGDYLVLARKKVG
jgi:glycosyltransferase involved in cell wall biosynthesis